MGGGVRLYIYSLGIWQVVLVRVLLHGNGITLTINLIRIQGGIAKPIIALLNL